MLVTTLPSHACDGATESVLTITCQGATADRQGAIAGRQGATADLYGAIANLQGVITSRPGAIDIAALKLKKLML
jgi:hypothetical protein